MKIQKLECSVLQSHVIPHCHVIQGCYRQGAKSNVSDQMEHKPPPPLQFCAALFVGNYAVVSLCSGEALVNEVF